MYRYIVAKKVRSSFAGLSAADSSAVISGLAKEFVYSFRGTHALGGTRTTLDDMEAWFDRVFRLLPGLQFDVRDVLVGGPPWNTTVLTRVEVASPGYENEIFQRVTLSWGKLTSIITMENLELLDHKLTELADSGVEEALAAPIQSL